MTEPEKLILGLVGLRRTTNDEFLAWFKSQVLKVVRDRIAELLVKKKWPLLDVTSGAYTEEIEQDVLAGLQAARRRLRAHHRPDGQLHRVSIKDDDEATLKRLTKDTAYSKLAGGFQAVRAGSGDARRGRRDGRRAGRAVGVAALQGAGLGVGFGMAQQAFQQRSCRGSGTGSGDRGSRPAVWPAPTAARWGPGASAPTAVSRWRWRRASAPTGGTTSSLAQSSAGNCGKAAGQSLWAPSSWRTSAGLELAARTSSDPGVRPVVLLQGRPGDLRCSVDNLKPIVSARLSS